MNALLLAAGLGSRFKEITKNNHKALLPIGGVPNIERTIGFLHDAGIKDITIVVGHMAELFDYLKDKYQVRLVYNEHYADYNNLYSMAKALPIFHDTLVIDADVVLLEQVIKPMSQSAYYTVQRKAGPDFDWCPRVENGRVVAMDITDAYRPSMLGISYWNAHDCEIIKAEIEKRLQCSENYLDPKKYWDNVPVDLLSVLNVSVEQVDEALVDEMDTVENYFDICTKFDEYMNRTK